jgi:(p)ppGpp synthase/HD superfamily hydrolase
MLESIASERKWRFEILQGITTAEAWYEDCIRTHVPEDFKSKVDAAHKFAFSLNYHHPGIGKQIYLAHPIRVAGMAAVFTEKNTLDAIVIALIHNVLEVTNVPASQIKEIFGLRIANTLVELTVDRNRIDDAYKSEYYGRLTNGTHEGCIVKCLDKLDNLFLLCLNPNSNVRSTYLDEIETWVLPMVKDNLPMLAEYFSDLLVENRNLGHIPLPEIAV